MKSTDKSKNKNNKIALLIASSIISTTLLTLVPSSAALTDVSSAHLIVKSDKMKSPMSLKVESLRVGETDLSWIASTTVYTTGYKILRSDNMYGPWDEIGSVKGRNANKFVDTSSGATPWFYRVESVYETWMSVSPGFEAPEPVGRVFFDSFSQLGDLNGKATEDGKSVWQVWNGNVKVENKNGWPVAAFGSNYESGPAIAVVRTPAQNALIFIEDLDGSEGVILRGKNPENYIYVGGAKTGTAADGSFEIVEVRNGVRNILKSGNTGAINRDMRIEINDSVINVFIDAIEGSPASGTLFMTQTTSFLVDDPTATYFGIGLNSTNGIMGFYFEAI